MNWRALRHSKFLSLERSLFPEPLEDIESYYYQAKIPDHDVPVLSDDYAPTDSLLHY